MIKGFKSSKGNKDFVVKIDNEEDIAIVGMNIELNGIDNQDAYWDALLGGKELSSHLSRERKEIVCDYDQSVNTDEIIGNYLDKIDEFDPAYFGIAPREAELMNPVQRRILHSVRGLFDNSGYKKEDVYGKNIGVFLGMISDVGQNKYREIIQKNGESESLQFAAMGNLGSVCAGRVSYFWNFTGPCISIDTACSSSLVAVQAACNAIKRGECSGAVVASANIDIIPGINDVTLGFESKSSHTRPFSENADGTSYGEGVISVYLKPLSKAVSDKDSIYAVIKGGAVNQDGRSIGLTVPNSSAQSRVIRKAWENSGIKPENITYIEAHGTGTLIGDPIEVSGINTAFQQYCDLKKVCSIGSVKGNIGHLYAAAGLAGLVKCALISKKRIVPPLINYEVGNKKIDFDNSYVFVSKEPIKCNNEKIICGISSFGLSGTNCHVILEEYQNSEVEENARYPFVITGNSKNKLQLEAKKISEYLKDNRDISYQDVCFTSCVGRNHLEFGKIAWVSSVKEIEEFLLHILEDEIDETGCSSEEIAICEKFLKNENVEWDKVFANVNVKRIYMPGHVYDSNKYWVGGLDHESNISVCTNKWVESKCEGDVNTSKNRMVVRFDNAELLDIFCQKQDQVNILDLSSVDKVEDCTEKIINTAEGKNVSEVILYYDKTNLCENSQDECVKSRNITLQLLFALCKSYHQKYCVFDVVLMYREPATEENVTELEPLLEAITGFSKSVNKEFGRIAIRTIAFNDRTAEEIINKELNRKEKEEVVLYLNGIRYIRELNVVELNREQERNFQVMDDDAYVISGGYGGIGLEIARKLSEKAKCNLFLQVRKNVEEYSAEKQEMIMKVINEIKDNGSQINVVCGDISDENTLKDFTKVSRENNVKIKCIFHCAGNPGKGFLKDKSTDEFNNVIFPKVAGTWNLIQFKEREKVPYLVCFSSEASVLALPGQSDYTAANCYMNGCSKKYENVITICWPAWKEVGMAKNNGFKESILFKHISVKDGIDTLFSILERKVDLAIVGEFTGGSFISGLSKLRMSKEVSERIQNEDLETNQGKGFLVNLAGKEDNSYTENEKKIAGVWGEVLGLHTININDNFYMLGGDSIQAVKIVKVCLERYGMSLSISDMMQVPTVYEIAKALDNKEETIVEKTEIDVQGDNHLMASDSQKRIYLATIMNGEDTVAYNLPKLLKISRNIDGKRLEAAFNVIIQRHEILRTTLASESGDLVQVIHPELAIKIKESSIKKDELNEYINQCIRPFDLSTLPLIRSEIIRTECDTYIFTDMHHIIVDGMSAVIMVKELLSLYHGMELPKLKYQYKDYVTWYDKSKADNYFDEARKYWKQKLHGDLVPISLSHVSGTKLTNVGKELIFELPENIKNKIEKFAIAHGGTTNMIMLMALFILIYRYANQEDVTVGTPVSGRKNELFDDNIGSFINIIPLRIKINEGNSIGDTFEEIKKNVIDAIEYQELSLEDISEAVYGKGKKSNFFHILYSYLNIESHTYKVHEIEIEQESIFTKEAKYELSLEVIQRGYGLFLRWEYMADLFSDEKIHQINNVYLQILENIDSAENVNDIEVCGTDQLEAYNGIYNNTEKDIDHKLSIVDLFERKVTENPEQEAVICEDVAISYHELNRKANQYARLFEKSGITEGKNVLILLGRSHRLIECLWGCLKLGATYIPMDPEYPIERIQYIIDDTCVDLIVTDRAMDKELNVRCQVVKVDGQEEELSDSDIHKTIDPNLDAYRIYTSGSTGNPKGVRIPYKAFINFVLAMMDEIPLDECNNILNVTTISFDIFVLETFVPLACGKTIVLATENDQLDMNKLGKIIVDKKVDLIQMTPSRANMLIKYCPDSSVLNNVKVMLLGGEMVPKQLVDQIKGMSDTKIFNVYGPTETTVWSSIGELTNKDSVDVGHFLRNTQGFIFNKHNKLQPLGGIGELCIAGEGLSNGYVNRDDSTAEKFIDNPYCAGNKVYKTGDLAYFDDNAIHVLGRIDSQVKVRGYRIELEEIENTIGKFDKIQEAAVKVQDDGQGVYLVGFYVSDEEVIHDDIRNFLLKKLPEYMVPAYIKKLDKIPYTPNGKIDRKKLPDYIKDNKVVISKNSYGGNVVEKQIITIWEACLGHNNFELDDNYFEVGGDSYSIIKMQSMINDIYPDIFSVVDLFQYSTIKDISQYIINKEGIEIESDLDEQITQNAAKEIAVVGIAAKLPKADNVTEFWEMLCEGTDFIDDLDEQRKLDVNEYISYVQTIENREISSNEIMKGAYLTDIDKFDYQYFKISRKEASLMDPNQRLLLQVINNAIEDAGYGDKGIKGTKTGVYVGNSDDFGVNYKRMLESSTDYHSGSLLTGNIKSVLAGRISYLFDLKGPSIVVDTACSSSLVAIDRACQDIRDGRCEQAIVGSSNLILIPLKNEQKIGIESSDAQTKTFDDSSDGTGVGEGVIAVVLKPLEKAVEEKDNIYAVIKGSAINQDGRTVGLTAPNATSQTSVIVDACRNAGISLESIEYFEAHGTGTKLGDPIEIQGITNAFRKYTDRKQFCAIGALKTNIGHLDNCAGIAGFLKTVLMLYYKTMPPMLHFSAPNRRIEFINSPLYVNDILRKWETKEEKRRAAVNAFGLSGTNCCVILEEAPERVQESSSGQLELFTLSAYDESSLLDVVESYIDYLVNNDNYSLQDICYTANIGRKDLNSRLAFVVETKEELLEALKKYYEEKIKVEAC